MWSCNRRTLLAGAGAGLLSACGFTPVYRQGGAAAALFGQMSFAVVEGRFPYELRERLIERLGNGGKAARWLLSFDLKIEPRDLVISESDEIIRYNLTGLATYEITDAAGLPVFRDTVKTVTAYSTTSDTYPTSVAERDANIRLARALADLMVTRMSLTAEDWAA